MRLLVGSTALKNFIPDIREPADVDWLLINPTAEDWDAEGEKFTHSNLAQWGWGEEATLDELYTLKVSHSFWELKNRSWDKHMFDIATMKTAGAELIPELYNILYPIWEERYGKKQANLEQEPDEFFNANVNRKYEHDSLHESVAYYTDEGPLFNRILRDNHQVAVDKNKFDALTEEDKHKLIREEVYATALERRLIPSNFTVSPKVAYLYALQKTITSFTKGWFPLYIVQNYRELRLPDVNYVAVHRNNADKLILL